MVQQGCELLQGILLLGAQAESRELPNERHLKSKLTRLLFGRGRGKDFPASGFGLGLRFGRLLDFFLTFVFVSHGSKCATNGCLRQNRRTTPYHSSCHTGCEMAGSRGVIRLLLGDAGGPKHNPLGRFDPGRSADSLQVQAGDGGLVVAVQGRGEGEQVLIVQTMAQVHEV